MKIADFGLARGVHQIDYYKKTTNVSESFLAKPNSPVKTASSVLLVNMSTPQPGSSCLAPFMALILLKTDV